MSVFLHAFVIQSSSFWLQNIAKFCVSTSLENCLRSLGGPVSGREGADICTSDMGLGI